MQYIHIYSEEKVVRLDLNWTETMKWVQPMRIT